MNPLSIVVRTPAGRPAQLILLLHGVGASPDDLVPLGRRMAPAFPDAMVVSVAATQSSANFGGREWFAVAGITEANRIGRVEQAMPAFLAEVGSWQQALDVAPQATALVGFSQGAIMALEASLTASPPAGRVIAIAGRFARLPERAPAHTAIHLVHGDEDRVIPCRHAIEGAQRLRDLGGEATVDVVPSAGHGINVEIADLVAARLLGRVQAGPQHEA